ncbi:MAG TPA: histidine kinase dimerization/phosphoacceptor domain -containing protein [Rectinemataceae bacterium]|nr:histidine kinase dimerization/phosphoacceptor domain -containing protein [Rectinemataceae bacterium]
MADKSPLLITDILERLPVGVFAVDAEWRIGYWNSRMARWTGIEAVDAGARPLGEILPKFIEPHNLSRLELVMKGGPPVVFSWQLHHDLYPVATRSQHRSTARYTVASKLPGTGGILFSVEDYTEISRLLLEARSEVVRRRAAEAALQKALAVKDAIVRESNHRIKNNLALVASLASIEEERAPNEAAGRFLAELGSRVRSIALLHELLYSRPIEEEPRLDEYLSRLSGTIATSYLGDEGPSRLSLQLEALSLPASLAIKVGLTLVELLTNAFKYAGSPEAPPSVAVSLSRSGDDMVLLVSDDGPGFPPGWRERRDSLGLVLIESFAADLGGSVEFLGGSGGRVRVRFPLPPAKANKPPAS